MNRVDILDRLGENMNKLCSHEWLKLAKEPYEIGIDYCGFGYGKFKCKCKKCGKINIVKYLK